MTAPSTRQPGPAELAMRVLTAIEKGDSAALSALLHDDIVWCTPRGTRLAPRMEGKREVAVGFAPWFERAAGGLVMDEMRVFEADNCAIVEFKDHAPMKDGSTYHGEGVVIFEVRDGRVAEIREHFNAVLFNQAFG